MGGRGGKEKLPHSNKEKSELTDQKWPLLDLRKKSEKRVTEKRANFRRGRKEGV